jgi:hypothetical protein
LEIKKERNEFHSTTISPAQAICPKITKLDLEPSASYVGQAFQPDTTFVRLESLTYEDSQCGFDAR